MSTLCPVVSTIIKNQLVQSNQVRSGTKFSQSMKGLFRNFKNILDYSKPDGVHILDLLAPFSQLAPLALLGQLSQ